MHARAFYDASMRTTIEIRDDLRQRLVGLAAARGEKGYSKIVEEALVRYLRDEDRQDERLGELLALRGTLSDDDAAAVRAEIERLRSGWRTP
jgi:metal-responsive CopG/Arc/MetJ family transcriptional regulator